MKLGFITSILDDWKYEEVVDFAAENGFACIEVACWPCGGAERRYAGVSHIDVNKVVEDEKYCTYVREYAKEKGVEISALAYYPNMMDGNLEKRESNILHLKKVIEAAELLQIGIVTTFIGRDQTQTVEENYKFFEMIWPEIIQICRKKQVKIAIENCPMLFGKDQWPGGQNLMTTPVIWKELFGRLPSDSFGINFDPSHFVWQQLDYISPIYEFKDKMFHIHFKDIKLYRDKLEKYGTLGISS